MKREGASLRHFMGHPHVSRFAHPCFLGSAHGVPESRFDLAHPAGYSGAAFFPRRPDQPQVVQRGFYFPDHPHGRYGVGEGGSVIYSMRSQVRVVVGSSPSTTLESIRRLPENL